MTFFFFFFSFYLSYCTANIVLEGACERVIVEYLYCDIPLGLYVIRGENVVIIGDLVFIIFSLSSDFIYASLVRHR